MKKGEATINEKQTFFFNSNDEYSWKLMVLANQIVEESN